MNIGSIKWINIDWGTTNFGVKMLRPEDCAIFGLLLKHLDDHHNISTICVYGGSFALKTTVYAPPQSVAPESYTKYASTVIPDGGTTRCLFTTVNKETLHFGVLANEQFNKSWQLSDPNMVSAYVDHVDMVVLHYRKEFEKKRLENEQKKKDRWYKQPSVRPLYDKAYKTNNKWNQYFSTKSGR